jgi:putative ABC transport system permease protein
MPADAGGGGGCGGGARRRWPSWSAPPLGATRRHVAEQFLAEALLLSFLGGLAGTIIGVIATAMYARTQHTQVLIPAQARYGGIGAALAIGAVAGLYPAMRAARLSPTEALRTV